MKILFATCTVSSFLWLTVRCPLQAALKKYQMEHKSKGESLEKCQAELKKLRRKSQGSKHPSKYGDKEMRVSSRAAAPHQQPCRLPASSPRQSVEGMLRFTL